MKDKLPLVVCRNCQHLDVSGRCCCPKFGVPVKLDAVDKPEPCSGYEQPN